MKKFLLVLLVVLFFQYTENVNATVTAYFIQVAHNDEIFIINGEKFEAQTYCINWDKGDRVIFIEGSPYGACATAVLYNLDKEESCDVWCE